MPELTIRQPARPAPGCVLWITGLSGAGKSTLAEEMARRLRARDEPCIVVDGDVVRAIFGDADGGGNTPHDREARLQFAFRYSRLGQLISRQGFTAIVSTISLAHEVHAWNRAHLEGYIEVYLKVPLDELRRRDPKGIYQRYDRGEISNVWGLDLPFDEPVAADIVIDHSPNRDVGAIADQLMAFLEKKRAT